MSDTQNCIFCKIIAGDIPSEKVFEDDHFLAFKDIEPKAPIHFLVIPKKHSHRFDELAKEGAAELGELFVAVAKTAEANHLSDYRVGVNVGAKAGQEVFHTHVHILSGWDS